MNPTFRTYPTHPWLSKWMLEPRGCGATFREVNAKFFFQTMEPVGGISPNTESPEWFLQVPIPNQSKINVLFNGFCAYFDQNEKACSAEIIMPAAGIIWGNFLDIPAPVLVTEKPIKETGDFQWLETDEMNALLAIRDGMFCLVTTAQFQADAINIAEQYLKKNLDEFLQQELDQRLEAPKLVGDMSHYDSLAVISAECMMRAIRSPEGNIPTLWSQSSKEDTPQLDTNELHALALAWRHLDIEMAEELFLGVMKLQSSSGAITVRFAPHTTYSALEAPKPVLAKTAEKIWETRKDDLFLAQVTPLLRRHLQWLLLHFDPKRRGLHCWQNKNETFAPESYQTNLATVDLTVLLLTEIEALNRLCKQSSTQSQHETYFSEEQEVLEHNLQTQFWNQQTEAYSNAYLHDKIVQCTGLSTLIPLLWTNLPDRQRNVILDGLKGSGSLSSSLEDLSRRKTAFGEYDVPLLNQVLLLDLLEASNLHKNIITDFIRPRLQGFVVWHTRTIEANGTLDMDPALAAYVIMLMEIHQNRYQVRGTISKKLIKFVHEKRISRFYILVIAILLAVQIFYSLLRQPEPFLILETQMSNSYSRNDMETAFQSCKEIVMYYPEQAGLAKVLAGNILMFQQQYEAAALVFTEVRTRYPDSPGAMISLGLAYQLNGEFEEATKNYSEFIYLFDEVFPGIVNEIEGFHFLMQEGFKIPPKWMKIYRYQMMHEL